MNLDFSTKPGLKVMHTFRSKVTGLTNVNGRLIACTERGVYYLQKNGKRWRKLLK